MAKIKKMHFEMHLYYKYALVFDDKQIFTTLIFYESNL